MTDSALAMTMEGRRPEAQRSPEAVAPRRASVLRGLDQLAGHPKGLPGAMPPAGATLGHIARRALLGSLDLRHGALARRQARRELPAWFEGFNVRLSSHRHRPLREQAATRPPSR